MDNTLQEYLDRHSKMHTDGLEDLGAFFDQVGFDTSTSHTAATPARFARYIQYMLGPYPMPHITTFPNVNPRISQMQVVPDITFWSVCSHHCLPFFGTISVGYLPDDKMVGLSKIALLVRHVARGFWMQEHLTRTIAEYLEKELVPLGVAVTSIAQHTCELMDVGNPPIPLFKQTELRGVMKEAAVREEYYRMIGM